MTFHNLAKFPNFSDNHDPSIVTRDNAELAWGYQEILWEGLGQDSHKRIHSFQRWWFIHDTKTWYNKENLYDPSNKNQDNEYNAKNRIFTEMIEKYNKQAQNLCIGA